MLLYGAVQPLAPPGISYISVSSRRSWEKSGEWGMAFPIALVRDENTGRENLVSVPQEILCSCSPALKIISSVIMTVG